MPFTGQNTALHSPWRCDFGYVRAGGGVRRASGQDPEVFTPSCSVSRSDGWRWPDTWYRPENCPSTISTAHFRKRVDDLDHATFIARDGFWRRIRKQEHGPLLSSHSPMYCHAPAAPYRRTAFALRNRVTNSIRFFQRGMPRASFRAHDRWEVASYARLSEASDSAFHRTTQQNDGTPCPFASIGQGSSHARRSRQRVARQTIPCAVPRSFSISGPTVASDRPAFCENTCTVT